MNNAITKALADVDRSYFNAKSAVGNATAKILAGGTSGLPANRPDLSRASEQLKAFTGWVYAAVRPIAQRIAGQPIHVGKGKGTPGGTKDMRPDPLKTHPLLDLIADPNDLMVSWSLMYVTIASLELTGRQLWWLPEQKQIMPIPTSWIVGIDAATRFTSFRIRPPNAGEAYDIPADECVYFSYPNPADPHGATSPLTGVAAAVDADTSIQHSQAAMFRNGIHPSHAVIVGKDPHPEVPGGMRPRLTDVQHRQIVNAIRKRYTGAMNHGEPLILDGMIEDIKKLSNTPAEMDWLNSGKATKDRIFQGFGVNPIIAGHIEGANRASSLAAEDHFLQFCINPKIELLSQTMTEWFRWIFNDRTLEVWIEPCVPHDAEMEFRWVETLAKHGVLTAHELRRMAPFELEEERAFDGQLVGGRDMGTTGKIEEGIRAMVQEQLGRTGADRVLELISPTRWNGNRRE